MRQGREPSRKQQRARRLLERKHGHASGLLPTQWGTLCHKSDTKSPAEFEVGSLESD